jgi:hypothetical protein
MILSQGGVRAPHVRARHCQRVKPSPGPADATCVDRVSTGKSQGTVVSGLAELAAEAARRPVSSSHRHYIELDIFCQEATGEKLDSVDRRALGDVWRASATRAMRSMPGELLCSSAST